MKQLLTFLFLLITFASNAQKVSGNSDEDAVVSTVKINADSRLALVLTKPVQKAFVGKIRGFRVQIYNGNDRKKANQAKLDFMKANPGVRSYLVYNNPQFRVRVGDFKARSDAALLQNKLSLTFNPCMIVPDVINYATPRKSKEGTSKNSSTTSKTDD
jgi:cell division protein FtsN